MSQAVYEETLRQLKGLSASGQGHAIFYSGRQKLFDGSYRDNRVLAEACQAANPDTTYTILQTEAGNFLNTLPTLIGIGNGPNQLTVAELDLLWGKGSQMFSQQAKGDVIAFVEGELRPGNHLVTYEYSEWFKQTGITSINGVPMSSLDVLSGNVDIVLDVLGHLSKCYDPNNGMPPTASAPVTENFPNLWPSVFAIGGAIVAGAVVKPQFAPQVIKAVGLLSVTGGVVNSTANAASPNSNSTAYRSSNNLSGFKFETPLLQIGQQRAEAILRLASSLSNMKLKGLVAKGKISESALQGLPEDSSFGYANWKTGRVSSSNLIIGKVTHIVAQENQNSLGSSDPQKPPVQPQSGDTGATSGSSSGSGSLGQPTILAPKPPAVLKIKLQKPTPKKSGWFSNFVKSFFQELFKFISNPGPIPKEQLTGQIYTQPVYGKGPVHASILPTNEVHETEWYIRNEKLPPLTNTKNPPLVLDLQNNGVETLSYENSNAQFDMQGDGFLHKTSWVSKNDALLAIDRNQNGVIDDVNELFGWLDKTGFDELRAMDTNQDNLIDVNDAEFSLLRSWQDTNEDGVTDTGELKTLNEAGIRSINLATQVENFENNGNHVSESATFTKTDGSTSKIYDVFFTSSNTYTQTSGEYSISNDLIFAPWVRGYGLVKDLLLVASEIPALKTLVLNLSAEVNAQTVYGQIDSLLSLWAGTPLAGQVPAGQYDPGKAEFVEKFLGLNTALAGTSLDDINQSYQDLKNKIFVDFIAQTSIGYDLGLNYDFVSDNYVLNTNLFYDQLLESLSNIQTSFIAYLIGTTLNDAEALNFGLLSDSIQRHGYGDFLIEYLNKQTDFKVQNQDGSVTGNAQNNLLYSTSTSLTGVTLQGNDGNDVVVSTVGSDTLQGGLGDDVYILDLQSGNDLISDTSGIDQVVLGAGISQDNLILSRSGNDLILQVDTHILATVQNFYTSGTIEKISFINGASLSGPTVLAMTSSLMGTTGNDLLAGNNFENTLSGDTGNDTLTGGAGNDTLNGGSGLDSMQGGSGDDLYIVDNAGDAIIENLLEGTDTVQSSVSHTLATNVESLTLTGSGNINATGNELDNLLTANTGANILSGGKGNDTYILDSSSDTVTENANEGTDTIQIGTSYTLGANVENLTLTGASAIQGVGNMLDNQLSGNNAASTLSGGLGNDVYIIQNSSTVITENSNEGTDTVQSSVSYTLASNVENLTLTGTTALIGAGNVLANQLIGNNAASTLVGGLGNDTYVIQNSSTVITENTGEGTDTVLSNVSYNLADNVENLTLTGSDSLTGTGNTLANQIIGNESDNTLDGGAGVDTLIGGQGNDTYVVDNTGDVVTENAEGGTDTVQSSIHYTLGANTENLTLTGSNNLMGAGNSLDNTLTGNAGASTLLGGLGNDTYILQNNSTVIQENLGEGTDTVQSSVSYTLASNVENLTLTGASALSATGNTLNNQLTGNNAASTLAGGLGNDVYVIQNSSTVIAENSGEGTDTVQSSVSYTLDANVENLTLTGTSALNGTGNGLSNVVAGNTADNTLDGGSGADTLVGGLGNDTYLVDDAGDVITELASEGVDSVQSSVSYTLANYVENLTLTGSTAQVGAGNQYHNLITGNALNNTLKGLDGDDTLDGGSGNDTLIGGTGNDVFIIDTANDVLVEALNEGVDTVQSSVSYTLGANVENLTLTGASALLASGNSLDNVLTGNSAIDTLSGGQGNDTYVLQNSATLVNENANEGIDTVKIGTNYTLGTNLENLTLTGTGNLLGVGNALDNILTANVGIDTLSGGLGNDTYIISNSNTVINENSNEGTDTVQSSDSYSLGSNVENLTLTGSNDSNASGNTLNNNLIGNSGNNILDGGSGADTLTGRLGDDTYIIDNINDVIIENSSEGTDSVQSSISYTLSQYLENLVLSGSSAINGTGNQYQNTLLGNNASNQLVGLGGDDTLDGGAGADTLTGGQGNDTYLVDNPNDNIVENVNEGVDIVASTVNYSLSNNIENLSLLGDTAVLGTGNALDNLIKGNAVNNSLSGGAGDDTLDGSTGSDTLTGGQGDDLYIVDNIGDVVTENLNEGTDTVLSSVSYSLGSNIENLSLTGTATIDAQGNNLSNILVGNNRNNVMTAYAGNDTLDGGAGADTLIGGTGDDLYFIDNSVDVITENANEGIDAVQSIVSYTLSSNVENLTLVGTDNINANGNSLNNVLIGNTGDNTLDGAAGADILIGQAGDDVYVLDNFNDVVIENANEGSDTVQSRISYTLGHHVENLTLATGAGVINSTGNTLNNQMTGNESANSLSGLAGDDTLDGGAGADTLIGGTGNDIYYVDNAGDVVTENASEGTDTVYASLNYTLAANVENLVLTGTANLTATGNSLANTLTGNEGNSTLIGGLGNDTYVLQNTSTVITENTGEGTDTVQTELSYTLGTNLENLTLTGFLNSAATGNSANNVLTGNASDNTLDGGTGIDTLIGGLGNDTYIVDNAGDVVTENANEGIDAIQSSVTYTLNANVENLTLTGASALSGVGNSLDNTLTGNTAASTLSGGLGNDTYVIQTNTTVITENVNEGTDTVQSSVSYTLGANVENLTLAGSSNLTATGNSLDNVLTGNTGNSTLTGGLGNDTYVLQNSTTVITENTSEGTDTVQTNVAYTLGTNLEDLTLTGSDAVNGTGNSVANMLTGNTSNNVLTALNGNDTLNGGGGQDILVGGLGNDTYVVNNAGVIITENVSEGTDLVQAGISYTLDANVENLTLTGTTDLSGTGNTLNNTITGNSGNNTIDGGTGADTLIGGQGNDIYVVDNAGDVVTENASEGTDTVQSSINYALGTNLENLTLTGSTNLTGTGNAGANILTGNAGNSTLTGGLGNDTYVLQNNTTVIVENASEGTDTVQTGVSYTLGANLENLTLTGSATITGVGNALDNVLTGNNAPSTLSGGLGNDTYIVQSSDNVIIENASEGTDTVQTSVHYSLSTNLENLTLTGAANLNGTGNTANNLITGNTGINTLVALDGNDTLDGGAGADFLYGGLGNDTYIVDNLGDLVVENSSEGTDTVQSSVTYTLSANLENLTLTGTSGISGTGNTMNNTLTGNIGNNILDGGTGADTLVGGQGNDTYIVDNAGDVVTENASEGTDTVQTSITYTLGANVENLTLTGSSNLSGTGNTLDNVLTGNTGNSTLIGGTGNDTYILQNTTTVITENASAGTDTVKIGSSYTLGANLENLTLTGSGNLSGTGNSSANLIIGTSGDNTLDGSTGVDTLVGGFGNDTYVVDSSSDVVTELAGQGIDTVLASTHYTLSSFIENLTLTGTGSINGTGNTADNKITGNSSTNNLSGGDGNDTLDGGTGADTLVGGKGDDLYMVDNAGDVLTENGSEGTDTVQSSISYTLANYFENLTLSGTGDISGTGTGFDNVLTGNSGKNTLTGLAGNDTLDGGAGADTMIGGTGDDTYYVDNAGDVITEISGEGVDTVISTIDYTLSANLNNLILGSSSNLTGTGNNDNNLLVGNAADNLLDGSGGKDTLMGGQGHDTYVVDDAQDVVMENANEGNDTVQSSVDWSLGSNLENLALIGTTAINASGNASDNILVGNSQNNHIDGFAGNDILDGGSGADTLTGGTGNDTYYVDSNQDVVIENAAEGTDTVKSSVTYGLGENVENLTLTGTANIDAIGNTLDNVLTGNSGNNWLKGGDGNDTYAFAPGAANDTVEDGSGNDTLDFSAYLSSLSVDLNSTSVSTVLGINANPLKSAWNLNGTPDGVSGVNDYYGNIWTAYDGNTANQGAMVEGDFLPWKTGEKYLYLDGTNDYVKSTGLKLDGNAYTMRFRLRLDRLTGYQLVLGTVNPVGLMARFNGDSLVFYMSSNGSTWNLANASATSKNDWAYYQWYDMEFTYSNTTGYKLFVDGSQVWSNSNTTKIYSNSGGIQMSSTDDPLAGGIADLYFTNTEQLHTSNFTPSANSYMSQFPLALQPQSAWYLNEAADGSTLISDVYGKTWIAYGGACIQSANPWKAGEKHIVLDGSNDYVQTTGIVPDGNAFTLRYRLKLDRLTGVQAILGGINGYSSLIRFEGNLLKIYMSSNGSSWDIASNVAANKSDWATNTWYDIEYSYSNTGGYKLFANGSLIYSTSTTTKINNPGGMLISSIYDPLAGAVTDVYFTNQTQLHTANFIPPTESYAVQQFASSIQWAQNSIENIKGGSGNDTLTGNANDNVITGGAGSDTLNGGAGNDTYVFATGFGTDTISDSAGTDKLDFSAFTTGLTVSLANTSFTESAGNTVSWSANVLENLTTGSGNDSLTGNSSANILNAGAGNDTLTGGAGSDTLSGGDGNDTYAFATGFGTDSISDSAGVNILDLSSFSSALSVNVSGTSFTESAGNTVSWNAGAIQGVKTGSGNDTLTGSSGDNLLLGGAGNDSLNAGDGNDTLLGEAGNDTLDGGLGNDLYQFTGTFGADSIVDAGGTDTLDLSGLTSNITFSLANTSFTASTGNTIAWAANALENVLGGSGNDTITGSTGDNLLNGGAGNDSLDGDAGNDIYQFKAGFGTDTITDASGNDTVDFSALTTSLTVNLSSTSMTESTGNVVNWSANTLENVITGSGNDTLVGTSSNNRLTGSAGNDTITGGAGNDTLNGGDGDDTFIFASGFGTDVIQESGGSDTLDFSQLTQDILFSLLNTAYQTSPGHVVSWTSGDIENVTGGTGNDSLEGSAGNNLLSSGSGNDTLIGGAGNDSLLGGSGNDTYVFSDNFGVDQITETSGTDTLDFSNVTTSINLDLSASTFNDANGNLLLWTTGQLENVTTGSGNDLISGDSQSNVLTGGSGNDTLLGNAGNDLLKGGAGDDTYVFKPGAGNDTIDDSSGNDTIDFSAYAGNLTVDLNSTSTNVPLSSSASTTQKSALSLNAQADGSTTVTDVYGNAWTAYNGASVQSANPWKAGEKHITFDGTNDYLASTVVKPDGDAYTIRWRLKLDRLTGTQAILNTTATGYGLMARFNSNSLVFYMSSSGGSWNIASGAATSKNDWATNTWYDMEFSFSTTGGYKLFVNGTLVYSNSSTAKIYSPSGLFMTTTADPLQGSISDLYFTNTEVLHSSNFTPSTSSYLDSLKDTISWNAGAVENVIAGSGNDVLTGTGGDNQLTGGAGNDSLIGGAGNDTYKFAAGFGVDTINDASGTDTMDFSAFATGLAIDLSATSFTESTGNTVTWGSGSIENLITGAGSDVLTGNASANWLNAGNGNNTLIGGAGSDTLIGGLDSDTYQFANGFGVDTLSDSAGFDSLNFSTLTDALSYSAITGQATASTSSVTWNTASTSIEKVLGGSGNDSMLGSTGVDYFSGGAGNDTLDGGTGNDTYLFSNSYGIDSLSDSSGTDTLDFSAITSALIYNASTGTATVGGNVASWNTATSAFENITSGSGNDSLTGGTGNETLQGGLGNDSLTGGSGNDLLQGGAGNDLYTLQVGDGLDVIQDVDSTPGNLDTVLFGNSVTVSKIAFFKSNQDLQIGFVDSAGDLISVQSQWQEATTVERFQLADGRFMTDADINQLINTMSAYAADHNISMNSLNDVKNNQDLMNLVAAGWHS